MKTRNRTFLTLAVAGLVLALAPAAQAGTISAGDPLIAGSGLSAGDTFQLVFVTSANMTFTTQEEDLNVYNQFVTDVANNEGAYTGSIVAAHDWSWKAIGSVQAGFPIPSPNHHAYNNAVVSAPVYNLNAEVVATDYADIWDGSLANPIKYTEQGTAAAMDVKVNTGSRANGSQDTASHKEYSLCGDQGTRTGNPHATDSTWIYEAVLGTSRRAPTGPLYGLSEALQVLADNAEPVADADGPYDVPYGATLDLDGSGSTDDSGIISYDWDIAGVLSASGATDSSITWQDLVDAGLSAGGAIDLTVTDDGTPGLTGTDGTTFTVGAAPSVIPKPASFLIWAIGFMGLACYARRRRRRL